MAALRLRGGLAALALTAAILAVAPQLRAQGTPVTDPPATLVADSLEIAGDTTLIATGNVEVFYGTTHVRAVRIVYDQAADRLRIDGPIRLTDSNGQTVIIADQGDLAADLSEGLLTSARIVLNQQLQIAASELRRAGGRYTDLDQTVASACRVCEGSTTPLWEIRANRVVHDQIERQLYFDHARLRVLGIPVFYVPRLRMPDPTLERATGFLTAGFFSSTNLGTGITVPYFIELGRSRDLTLTPLLTTDGARSLDLRYRQAFRSGNLLLQGALSRDKILPDDWRGYLRTEGRFALPEDFGLSFNIEAVSDDAYFADYEIVDRDLLRSDITFERVRRAEYVLGRVIAFRSLRGQEEGARITAGVVETTWDRRFRPAMLGGELGLNLQLYGHNRRSTSGGDVDGDGISDGRDLVRGTAILDWRRDWVLAGGVIGALQGQLAADVYGVGQDDLWGGRHSRVLATAGAELRWPLVKTEAGGARQVLEPLVQVAWSGADVAAMPSEDSLLVEFDEGNLLSFTRFPGRDSIETGLRAGMGLRWSRLTQTGWGFTTTMGRILRDAPVTGFTLGSGNQGRSSDWMIAGRATSPAGFDMQGRMLLGDDLTLTRGEMLLAQGWDRLSLGSGYIWAAADVAEKRPERTSELVVDGSLKLTPQWQATASGRYDFEADRPSRTGLSLTFRNECLSADVSLSRRYTSSTSVKPVTTVQFQLDLLGFGSGTAGPARTCRR
jgi:LPS-assembly protein